MGRIYFVTGTDTGVGKTYVTYWIAKFMKERNINVKCIKPIETGVEDIPQDALMLSRATGQKLEDVIVYSFSKPLAPYAAILEEGGKIDIERIKKAIYDLGKEADIVLVEGAGGIAVPILENYNYADLCIEVGMPVLLVARAKLGTINHTFLTWFYAVKRGIGVTSIIMNGFSGDDISERTNPSIVEKLTGIKPYCLPEASTPPEDTINRIIDELIL